LLAAAIAGPTLAAGGCARDAEPRWSARWVGGSHERGHRLRSASTSASAPASAPSSEAPTLRRAEVLVVGGGIAGLAAARALTQRGIDDVRLIELEDSAGGNSRGHRLGGMACPLGAHYLPTPDERAEEVIELLEALGLRRTEAGRAVYDERHLCHSPQERLFIEGQWVEGLLPPVDALPADQRASTLAQYQRFAAAVAAASRNAEFSIPTARARWSDGLAALDGITFARWLDAQQLTAPALRWYLDYCCRDDFGAGIARVSAWAGLHYFASRHGFHPPGGESGDTGDRDAVLTWPEGNGWLSARMAAPLGERVHSGRVVERVVEERNAVLVDVVDTTTLRRERWQVAQVVLAVPLFVAARLLASPPEALRAAAAQVQTAPWLVSNLHLDAALADRPGAPPSWDNVLYGSAALGYVDAMHQSLRAHAGPTVLTAYWALGGDTPEEARQQRQRLLEQPAPSWAATVMRDVARAHADLPARVTQVDLMRYGHAMSIPVPGVRGSAALRALQQSSGRVHFAHTDLSGYSVFEEAMYQGVRAAGAVVQGRSPRLSRASALRSPARPPARHG
jgi:predicted NAD/FAD-dependent oxidoreductase